MDGGKKSSSCGRVVVLSHDAALTAIEGEGQVDLEVVRADTAYEAAAELLAAPTSALVVELHLLPPRHLRLLEIARRMDVEMLAVGSGTGALSAEALSGVRLLSRQDLPEAVRSVVESPEPEAPQERAPRSVSAPQAPTPEPAPPPAPKPPEARPPQPRPEAPAPEPAPQEPAPPTAEEEPQADAAETPEEPKPSEDRASARPGRSQPTGEPKRDAADDGQGRSAEDLLTPEEISALLGDDT